MPAETPRTLLIGFDSAWTPKNQGAIVAALHHGDGIWHELGNPQPAAFFQARDIIQAWRDQCRPSRTLILLDQPTIVPNPTGQRPVEHIVSSAISLRFGGVQPASTSRSEMFGASAPIWRFLTEHGNITDPFHTPNDITVLETYPALALVAFGWVLHDEDAKARPAGRLPKYNPQRGRTFKASDWQFVCKRAAGALRAHGLTELSSFTDGLCSIERPRKRDQDKLDALICLLVGIHLLSGNDGCVIGCPVTGLMVVPESTSLQEELALRCTRTKRDHAVWVRSIRL